MAAIATRTRAQLRDKPTTIVFTCATPLNGRSTSSSMVLGRSRVLLFLSFSRQIWRQRSLRSSQSVRWYYVKPKNKSMGSSQAWLAMAGVTLTIAGGGLYALGE